MGIIFVDNNSYIIEPKCDEVSFIAVAQQGIQGVPGVGVPPGGTAGQILAKINGTDYNTHWIDAPSGGGVTSFNSRTGAVEPESGDYDTGMVTEGSNLYFTGARAVTALTGADISIFANDVGYITNATGLIEGGTNVSITGSGTSGSPYIISASGGGGGSPGGGQGAIQVNNSGAFYGDESNLFYDVLQKFVGIQTGSPLAPIHVVGAIGQKVLAPATLTAVLVLDTAINSPATGSATQINGPLPTSAPSINFTYIDMPTDAGWFANQNTGESGFTAQGQTLNYNIYAARYVGGVPVINPNAFSSITFTDTLNDGTPFGVDIGGWTTPNGYQDTYIISRFDSSTGLTEWQDIGNNTTYADQGFTGTNNTASSAYPSNSSTYNGYTLGYNVIGGSQYTADAQNGNNTDSNIASAYLIINATFSASPPDDGLYYETNNSQFFDLGNSGTSFDDYGQSGAGAPAAFSSIAFPYFNTSLSDGSFSSSSQNDGSGNFTANGLTYNYAVYEYRYYPGTSVRYFTGGYTFQVFDNSDGQPFTWGIDVNPGDGDGRIWVNTDYGGGGDMGGGTHFDDDGAQGAAPANTPTIGSFAGITRNWSAYGEITSPAVKYSSTHKDYSATDNNPTTGYIYQHTLATFGNATDLKIIETATANSQTIRGPGNFYNSATAGTIIQTNTGLGDATVTPNTTGYQANGSNLNNVYTAYATKTINSVAVWSAGSPTATTVDPNNGLFYNVAITIGAVSGATYKLKRVNGASTVYQTSGSTSFQDDTTVGWGSSSTLTPMSAPVTAAIFERNISADTDLPIIILRSSNSGTVANTGIQFQYGGGAQCGAIIITGSGNMRFSSFNGGYEFYNSSNALNARILPTQFLLNAAQTSYEIIWYKNSSAPILYVSASTPFFGVNHNGTTPDSNVVFSVKDGNANGYTMMNLLGSNSYGGNYITASGKVSGKNFNVDANAQVVIGFNGTNTGAQLTVYGQSTTVAGLLLASGTIRTSPLANTIENDGTILWYTNNSAARSKLIIYAPSSSGSQNVIQKPDVNGRLINSALSENGTLFVVNIQTEFKQNISLDSSRYIGLGNASSGSSAQLWYNGTQVFFGGGLGNVNASFQMALFSQSATGTVANTAAETSLDSTGIGTKTIAASVLTAGKTIRVKGRGFFSAVSAPTLRIKIKLGANIVLDTTAVTSLNATNAGFEFEGEICCRTTGTSGTVFAQGKFEEIGSTLGAFPMTNTGTVTIATNASQVVGVTAQWGTGSASNTISLTNLTIEVLN